MIEGDLPKVNPAIHIIKINSCMGNIPCNHFHQFLHLSKGFRAPYRLFPVGMSVFQGKTPELRVKKVKLCLCFLVHSVRGHKQGLYQGVKAEKFIVLQSVFRLVLQIFFRDNSGFHILIGPFSPRPVIIPFQRPADFLPGRPHIQILLVPAYHHAPAVMGAFQHKLAGKTVEVNVVKGIPYAQCGNDIFLSDFVGHIFFHLIFVN